MKRTPYCHYPQLFCSLILFVSSLWALTMANNACGACLPPPAGLVSWWPGEANANDIAGTNNGTFINGAAYDAGEVGIAFSFSGAGNTVMIPASASLDVGKGGGFTVEAWIKTSDTVAGPIIEWAPNGGVNGTFGVHFWVNESAVGALYANLFDTAGQSHFLQSAGGVVTNNVFQHVALTYDRTSGSGRLYANGVLVTETPLGDFTPVTNPDVYLGYRPNFVPFGPFSFAGDIDEVSIYSRALTTAEIQSIYAVGSAGKCTTPVAPAIYLQPTNQTVIAGQTVNLIVVANGTLPLSYEWNFNGGTIEGATSSLLTLTNIQQGQAGSYTVLVTNSIGSVTSSPAILTVNPPPPPPPCAPAPGGVVSWWPGNGDASDIAGPNNGIFTGPAFDNGEVGEGFSFNAGTNSVRIPASPSLDVGKGGGLTVEAWIKTTDNSTARPIVEWAPHGNFGVHFWAFAGGVLYANLFGTDGVSHTLQSPAGLVTSNTFQHVALTYDKASGVGRLFINGTIVTESKLGALTPVTSSDLYIGYRPSFLPAGPISFAGVIDEVTLYSRALATNELQAIYSAGPSGKCVQAFPVGIVSQPADQVVTVGQTATFYVGAVGTQPLSYQWTTNGVPLPGATNSILVLSNAQMSQAGTYSVLVTNSVNSVTSSNAVLTVNFPPANVLVQNSTPDASGNVVVPVLLVANGNENGLGFSINANPALLSYVGVSLGSGASGAALLINSNQIASGFLGVALSLQAGASFLAGTQEVVDISFAAAALTNATVAQLTFGDQPTKRELSDPQANPLAASFIGGTVSISAADFEGDVSPRPNGDKQLTITDWVLVGRYAARLDYPTNASEYQRADCAPRSTLGDGAITVADWVQAGRYAAGLDPATRAGGPTNDLGPTVVNLTTLTKRSPKGLSRQVRVADINMVQAQSGTVSVYLDAQGDENALGFSVTFDPTVLAYLTATLGADAPGATLEVNTNHAATGRVAFVLALPVGSSFTAGTKQILKLNLGSVPSAAGLYPVALTDQPVVRQVVDPTATPLVTTYINGSVTVTPPPSLTATLLQQNISLSWPLWATNFTLQEADGTLLPSLTWSNVPTVLTITNNSAVVTLPISGTTRFYRLHK
jgi:hypothetical protein